MRLVDADVLEDQLGISDRDIYCKEVLSDAPTIEAEPVIHTKWINVKDRLPDKQGYYLVAIPNTWRKVTEWNIFTLFFRGKTKWATCNGSITHWMSLPEHPSM